MDPTHGEEPHLDPRARKLGDIDTTSRSGKARAVRVRIGDVVGAPRVGVGADRAVVVGE
jgi:hypothetical protein